MQLTALVPLSPLLVLLLACFASTAAGLKHSLTVSDHKEWKKLLKTRTNILALFASGEKQVGDFLSIYDRVAKKIMGKGTLVFMDCGTKDGKKLCKNLKVKPNPFVLKHYKDGSFHKDYDRLLQEKSLLSFMENPTADPPWSEDPTAGDVRHIEGPNDFERLVKKEKKPLLTMFYAPWCGHCKRLKPEYAAAATELKGKAVLAGMDLDTPDAYGIRQEFNVSGFPTLVYFERGVRKYDNVMARDKESILEWMKDPKPPEQPKAEEPWSEVESDVVHLTDDTFDSFLGENPSVLVMFYAPWCGHCKAMKPHFMEAAAAMKEEGIEGVMAAVDATKETAVAEKFGVKGYPAVKYFKDGELAFDYGYARTTEGLLDFMKEPKEPPPPEPDWTEVESQVNHLTDEDFKTFLKKKKHALVMFYAPWCGHCKAAKPEYVAAAEQFSEEKKTAFAAVDCTKFRPICTQYEVTGFPTFKYFSYGKNPFRYQGERNEAGFVEFMTDPAVYTRSEL